MGASAREIEQEIKETRERMEQNLSVLENRAASGAVRYAKIAAVGIGATAAAVAAFLIYRRARKPDGQSRRRRDKPTLDCRKHPAQGRPCRYRHRIHGAAPQVHTPGSVAGGLRSRVSARECSPSSSADRRRSQRES